MLDIVENKTIPIVNLAKKFGYSEVYSLSELKVVIGGAKNRSAVENKAVDVLLDPHKGIRKDHLHFRQCGLNHIMCKLANKNKVTIGFSFGQLGGIGDLGRVMQTIKLCKKYKVKVCFVSLAKDKSDLRSSHDVLSLAKVLGADKRMLLTKKIKK